MAIWRIKYDILEEIEKVIELIGTGLASSASGLAALTLAATKAAGLNLNQKELSILARQVQDLPVAQFMGFC